MILNGLRHRNTITEVRSARSLPHNAMNMSQATLLEPDTNSVPLYRTTQGKLNVTANYSK